MVLHGSGLRMRKLADEMNFRRLRWKNAFRKINLFRARTPEPSLDVSKVLSPILTLGMFFGLRFYWWRNRTRLIVTIKFLVTVLVLLSLYHEIPSIAYWESSSSGLHGFIVKLDDFSWWSSHILNFWITTFRNGKLNELVDKFRDTNLFLALKTQRKIYRFHLIHLTINIGSLMLYNIIGHDCTWPNPNYDFLTSKIYCLGDTFMFLPFYEFLHLVNLIGQLFRQINLNLKRLRLENADDSNQWDLSVGEIMQLRRSHLYLIEMCAKANVCFADQLLIVLSYGMIQAIYAVRSIIGGFQLAKIEESLLNITADSLWFTPFIMSFIQLIIFCEKTANENKKILTTIHHVMNVHYNEGETFRELEIFAVQVQQHPIRFHVRFFELHYPFLNTLVSSLMTYVVVFATFQGESSNGQLVSWNFNPPTTLTPDVSTPEL